MKDRFRITVVLMAAMAAVAVLCLMIAGCAPSSQGTTSPFSSAEAPAQESTTPDSESAQQVMPVGAVGQLRHGDPAWVLIARTKEAHDELDKAIAARDTDGLMELVREGRAFQADSGAKIKVIETDWFHGLSRVRILDGPHSRESGWLYSQLVVP